MKTIQLKAALVESKSGFACGKRDEAGYVQLRMNNVHVDGSLDLSKVTRIPASKKQISDASLQEGDVLFNCTNSPELVGKTCYFGGHNEIVLFSNHFIRLRCDTNKLDPAFLARWLTFLRGLGHFTHGCVRWVNQATYRKEDLLSLKVPLPPLAEQQRIAGILDAADALRATRRQALAHLDALLQSTFLDLFGDPVLNPMGWETPTVKRTNSIVQIGPFGSLLHKEDYIGDGVPLINPKHIKDGIVIPGADETVSSVKLEELSAYQLRQGDVIMGRRGEMGRCAVIDSKTEGLLCGTGSLFIRPNENLLHPIYLFMVLSNESMRKHLEKVAWGVTMANLNRTKVEELQIPIPPLDLQRRFAAIVAAVERQKARQRDHLAELDTLFAALQQRAFTGEL